MEKIGTKISLIVSSAVLGLGVLVAVGKNNKNVFNLSFAKAADTWVHYTGIEPSKNSSGIKEFYVSCTTHEHVFTAPASYIEGTWDDTKKSVIINNNNDDRKILSFNELDANLSEVTGEAQFDFVEINKVKNYINSNYSETIKDLYVVQSNKVYELDEYYNLIFETEYNMKDATVYNGNTKMTVTKDSDSVYGPTLNITINENIPSGLNSSFILSNYTNYFSTDNESINFAVYSSEKTEFNMGLAYNEGGTQYMNFKFNVGWNHFTYLKGTTYYNYFTNANSEEKTIKQLSIVLVTDHTAGNVIKVGSFFGDIAKSEGDLVKHKISKLPIASELSPYDISKLNKLQLEYNQLSPVEKEKVTNYSVLTSLKDYWDSLYILLYDMNADYAGVNTNATLSKDIIYDNQYGYAMHINVDKAGTYIDLNNVKKAYTTAELTQIKYMLKPNQDCYMSWSNMNNYGRAEWDGQTKLPDMTMIGNIWNEFVIEGSRSTGSNITQFMNYFCDNNATRNDFVGTSDRWNDYLVKKVGFSYSMSSIIGVKKVDETVTNLINKINSTCVDTPTFNKLETLNEIETTFETLTTTQKEQIKNIDSYYDYKDVLNQSYPYLFEPSIKLRSLHQKSFITDDDFIYGINSKYGTCYKFSFLQENNGTNITFDFPLGKEIENNGFYVYIKGFSNDLKLCSHEPNYGVDIATISGVSVGDGWYKYSFSKANYDSLVAIGTNYRVSYCFSGHNLPNKEIYMSGTFFVPVTNENDRNTVQSLINTVNSLEIDEFLGSKITEVQKEIVKLSSVDQSSLKGLATLNNKYALYKQRYASVYSMGVYRVGKWWTGCVDNIVKSYDANYGDIYSVISNTTDGPYLTIGCWELNGTKGSHRGYGKELSPLPEGKYKRVSFAIYIPYNPNGSSIYLKGWDDGDINFDLLSQTLVEGWNKITFEADNLNKLCGSNGNFKGISIVLPAKSDKSYEYKISSFIGEKDLTYNGVIEHYAQDSLHNGSYNIESTEYKMVGAATSDYKFVSSNDELTNEAIGFINSTLNKKIGVTLPIVNNVNPSNNSRHIYLNDSSAMAKMGISVVDRDVLESTGYTINTIGSSIFIFAYGKEGYELAAAKFLEATIGYDWMANDYINYEKNGTLFDTSISIFTPDFNVLEKPDYSDRYHSNAPTDHLYGSYLEQSRVYNPNCCNASHYLPTDTYQDCYYKIHVDETLHIDASVLCFNGKGDETRRNNMIKVIGDKMIAQDKLDLGYTYSALFQGDTSETCNCSACTSDILKHGSASYSVVKFLNDLDNYIKDNYKDRAIKLIFLVYNATFVPPNDITCNEDVIPLICPANARWNHSFYEIENSSKAGENGYIYDNDFAGKVEKWDEICSDYVMWAYQAQNANFFYVYNTFESMYEQYRYFDNNGCDSMFSEGVTATVVSGFVTLKDYLDSKALFDVNGSYDEVYEKFFKYYYGDAGEVMRIIFDEAIANVNFLADNYGRQNTYNPNSHSSNVGGTYYYDGTITINDYINYATFWNNTGNCYNGNNGSCNGKNIANLPYWISLANEAVSLTEHGDPTIFKHVQRDVIFVYYCDYEINNTSDYVGRICKYCYDVKCYWANETDMRKDNYKGLEGTNTVCYHLTGKTFKELYLD